MTGQSEPRMVPPDEARELAARATSGPWKRQGWSDNGERPRPVISGGRGNYIVVGAAKLSASAGDADLIAAAPDLAHTAAVLGEQRDAVLVKCAEWADTYDCYDEDDEAMQMAVRTLRAIYGVTA